MSAIGRAGWSGTRDFTTRPEIDGADTVDSTTDPHSPHSGHRPTHFGGWWPQTSHW